MKKLLTSFLLTSVLPLAALSLAACGKASMPDTATSSGDSSMAQMDHGSMSSPSGSSSMPMQMDHSSMMNMDLGPADEQYDLRFIDAMIPHHQGAIEMANEALQKSKRPEIKSLAQNIIKAQDREENELMRKWRKAWYPNAPETPMAYNSQMGHMMPMTAEQKNGMMMTMDLGPADDQFDLRFLNAMIPHHEGAIVMAKDALSKSKRPEIQQLANEIIASQQSEIDQMKQWRKQWYNQ